LFSKNQAVIWFTCQKVQEIFPKIEGFSFFWRIFTEKDKIQEKRR